ncbi:MAG TPA: hypothetical protein VL485_02710 [Ktedonobacteraceae bacterium]|nr:hypothetical protein [Ktedonobacteraceae bacterium]
MELRIKRKEEAEDIYTANEGARERYKTRSRPQDLCKRISGQGERAENIVQGHKCINKEEKEEICEIIRNIRNASNNDLATVSNSDFTLVGRREQAIRRIMDSDSEMKQILQVAQKQDNGQALKSYLLEAMRHRVGEDFKLVVDPSVKEGTATRGKKIAGGLQLTIHDKSKVKHIKEVVKSTDEFAEAYRKVTRANRDWHDWHKLVRDYSDCRREFAHNETELTFEQVDDMRARILKARACINTWMGNKQFSQRTLQEFANQQEKFADQHFAILDKTIRGANDAKEQIASGYLVALIEKMEASRESLKNEVKSLKNDMSTVSNDILNADLKQFQTVLRDFLWSQLDPKRARQGEELFRKSYEQGSPRWREHLRSEDYGKEMQLLFMGQRAMTYHETKLIRENGGNYFFTPENSVMLGRAYSFVPSTAKMVGSAYSDCYPHYNSARPISSYLQELSGQWKHYAFGWHNTPEAQRSYKQQGLLYMYPYGAVETFIKHTSAFTREFSYVLMGNPTLQEHEKELMQNFIGVNDMNVGARKERVQRANTERDAHQEEIRDLVARKLPHLSAEDQKYIREFRICYRSYDVEYRFMKSDIETIEEERHVQKMIEVSGIHEFLARNV